MSSIKYNQIHTNSLCVLEILSWDTFTSALSFKAQSGNHLQYGIILKKKWKKRKEKKTKNEIGKSNDFQSWLTSLQSTAEQICQFCYSRKAQVCNMRIWVCVEVCIIVIINEDYFGSWYICVQPEQVDGKLCSIYFHRVARLFAIVLGIISPLSISVQWWAPPKKFFSDLRVKRKRNRGVHTNLESFQCQTCFGTERAGSHHSNTSWFERKKRKAAGVWRNECLEEKMWSVWLNRLKGAEIMVQQHLVPIMCVVCVWCGVVCGGGGGV